MALFGQAPMWLLGLIGLGIVWVNALLIALAALREARRLGAIKGALGAIKRGKVTSERLATHAVEQVGRALDGPLPAMLWHDRSYSSVIEGGEVDGETLAAAEDGEVWPAQERQIEIGRCPSDEAFDAHYKHSRGAKGALRKVETPFREGDEVWIGRDGKLISAIDPVAWLSARQLASVAFALAELGLCGALTAVALHEPRFGLVSTLGAAGLLLFFIFVQPIGVGLEDGNRSPSERFLHGEWQRSAPLPEGAGPGLKKREKAKPATT